MPRRTSVRAMTPPEKKVRFELLRKGTTNKDENQFKFVAASSVLRINIAIVIGPTPPGTGVIAFAT